MDMESPIAQFLDAEIVDWRDDVVARARYKAFTGQREDWEWRLQFWRDVVVKAARHLDLMVIDPITVQQKWFLREGVTPLGISRVLSEMHKSGELQTREELLGSRFSIRQYAGSFLKHVFLWVGNQVLGTSESSEGVYAFEDELLIVTPLLQEKISRVIKALAEEHWSSVCVTTIARFEELCGGQDTADIVMGVLLLHQKALHITVNGKDDIKGLKIALKEGPVPDVLESDCQMLQLHWTMERLQQQLCMLDQRIVISRALVSSAMKSGEKQAALRHARRLKSLTTSKEKCGSFMDRIHEVVTVIGDAETTKKVSDAVKVGAVAVKEHHVTLDEVHTCLQELDETISLQRETEDAIGAPFATVTDDAELEEEFAYLEAEMKTASTHDNEAIRNERVTIRNKYTDNGTTDNRISGQKVPSSKEGGSAKDLQNKEALEKEFAKLELELA